MAYMTDNYTNCVVVRCGAVLASPEIAPMRWCGGAILLDIQQGGRMASTQWL
jgi:hypothetical protein